MENLSGQYESGIDLAGKKLSGMVLGSAIVTGKTAIINGMVCGNLTIEAGSMVEVNGLVLGDVVNHGILKVSGIIQGELFNMPEG